MRPAVVTGGARGLGATTAARPHEDAVRVVTLDSVCDISGGCATY